MGQTQTKMHTCEKTQSEADEFNPNTNYDAIDIQTEIHNKNRIKKNIS